MYEVESLEHEGVHIKFYIDEDPSSPRTDTDCNLGTMVCWHPDYILGDYQLTDGAGRGAIGGGNRRMNGTVTQSTRFHRDDFKSMEILERYLRLAEKAIVVMPLYLLDHSGISISAGAGYVARGDTAIPGGGRDSWGVTRGWDTTMVGFIYTTAERCAELCGTSEGGGLYAPSDWEGESIDWIVKELRQEVETYDQYLRGDVYGYVIQATDEGDKDNFEELDSCWGFFGIEYAIEEAKLSAEHIAKSRHVNREPLGFEDVHAEIATS